MNPACRCAAQLSVLGYILVPIFLANRWWLTLLYTLFMLAVAAVEAVSRPQQTYDGMLLQVKQSHLPACLPSEQPAAPAAAPFPYTPRFNPRSDGHWRRAALSASLSACRCWACWAWSAVLSSLLG
jgi:hypothetical protein